MKTIQTALLIALLAAPAFSQTMPDLPRLTWPDAAPTSMGCISPTYPTCPRN